MALEQPFSKRHGFSSGAKEITIREDAPENLRYAVLQTPIDLDSLRWTPTALRAILCRVLRVTPDPNSQREYPNSWGDFNVWEEVQALMYRCDWFKVYDIIEALHAELAENDTRGKTHAVQFTETLNDFFIEEGIGWQLVDGKIITRGTEAFETMATEAASALETAQRPTAAKHLHEALEALSRRPKPDLPGAAYHAMGSLECVARDLTGDPKATLGEILKRHPGLLPKPLDTALSQVWGYASNEARHVLEGREISREEAELLVGLSGTVSTYLVRKPTS
jgi:AbiJ N-terminal domain 4